MKKAKDFWQHICVDLGFKLFTGVPCKEFKDLYDTMYGDVMHYIPATSELVALGMVNGYWFTGQLGAVLCPSELLHNLVPTLVSFNVAHRVPALVLVPDIQVDLPKDILTASKGESLEKFVSRFLDNEAPAVLSMRKRI
jgi:sulfopyruvate decarboxylase TPP-binding subunit